MSKSREKDIFHMEQLEPIRELNCESEFAITTNHLNWVLPRAGINTEYKLLLTSPKYHSLRETYRCAAVKVMIQQLTD
jgi:hypothetical protein